MGRHQREKGKRGEREAADLLRRYGFEARRGRQFKGTEDSPDVVSDLPFHLEVKRRNAGNPVAWYEKAYAEGGDRAVVLHRRDRGPWLATLSADALLSILKHALVLEGDQWRLRE